MTMEKLDPNFFMIAIIIFCILIFFIIYLSKYRKRAIFLEKKYEKIIDIDKVYSETKNLLNKEKRSVEKQIDRIKYDYINKKKIYDELLKKIEIYDDEAEMAELGLYKPRFDLDTPEQFKDHIKASKEMQKDLLRIKNASGAIYCDAKWSVGDSKTEGRRFIERSIKLTARAFNNECDACIAKCTWKNILQMEQRIVKAYNDINKLNESNHIYITTQYLQEKFRELHLTHEYKERKQEEKEEQAQIKAMMREEEKAEKELRKAEEQAIKEEEKYKQALEVARQELNDASERKREILEQKIQELQNNLHEAENRNRRAKSMAQQTKQGHVYVISNIGSFGKNIFKIGMTRRLEPMGRVKELSDASVPFSFDVHAMIHTENAPFLEKSLHNKFDHRRVNMVNNRKEFFNVSLDEIQQAAEDISGKEIDFIHTIVAKEFYESRIIKKESQTEKTKASTTTNQEFAEAI